MAKNGANASRANVSMSPAATGDVPLFVEHCEAVAAWI
jgi:hypothetical protein